MGGRAIIGLGTSQKNEGAGAGGSNTRFSVTGDGSLATPIQLVNDVAVPGNDKQYGTGYTGTRGFFDPDIPVFNVVKGGGDNTGVVDVAPTIIAALAAGFRVIYFPAGTYLQNTNVVLPNGTVVTGAGNRQVIITTTGNVSLYTCGFDCEISRIGFRGNNPAPNPLQRAIRIGQVNGCNVHDCYFDFFANAAIYCAGNALLPGTQSYWSNLIYSNFFTTCVIGIWLDVRAEYFLLQGNTINDGNTGILINGGNNNVTGNNVSGTGLGISYQAGANDGHGNVTANLMNHCPTAISCANLVFGVTFTGNMIYDGSISIVNSNHVVFNGGDYESAGFFTITVTNSPGCYFNGITFIGAPIWVITGVPPLVINYDAVAQSWSLIDPVNNKQLDIASINGVNSLAGVGFSRLLVGATADNGTGKTMQVNGGISTNDATAIIRSQVAMADGAAASTGTLLNAPAAGNPTKWLPFNDNGTVRYIPAW